MMSAKLKYQQLSLLFSELTDFLLESEKSSSAFASISHYFTACQAEQIIEIERHCKEYESFELHRGEGQSEKKLCTLFNLTVADVNPPANKPESIGVRLIPELERRFLSRVEALAEYIRDLMKACGRDVSRIDKSSSFGVGWSLQVLTEEKRYTRECEENSSLSHARACALAHEHSRILLQSLSIISEILKSYKYEQTVYYDVKVCESLEKRCQTMNAKLEMLHHSLIRETYSQEAVIALKKIRFVKTPLSFFFSLPLILFLFVRELTDASLLEAIALNNTLRQRLGEYERVGLGFADIVAEYTKLLQEIEDKKWALQEISQSKK